ncbi:thiopeptide-type bacteriocin biosynthesis protein [Deinococcus sp. HMF7604]|uniref:thiopeptide-type bacteriocin biosynthesis protein n=1 Tax=Deinococcus betulae TaxID=2873312 RepID=UPI001CC94827|nr:thiopeptide-type bacteriocin biosynthesis protein [Deinococcus betulae]MBZ9751416.1 thiopeptide-type bacteriocin biosynthesis protein [Deinococcus betulae]
MTTFSAPPVPTPPPVSAAWVSLHAHTFAPVADLERALHHDLFPLLGALQTRGELAGWFFIRYWEGGPHIRMRLRDPSPQAAAQVEATLTRTFAALPAPATPDPEGYYAAFVPPAHRMGAAEAYGWYPHGQVRAVPYEPETLRYGGRAGLGISEAFFETSSAFAAQILPLTPSRASRLGLGLHLLLTTVRALDLDTPGGVSWLREFVNAWPLFSSTPTEQVARARERAEATYFAAPPSLTGARQTYAQRPERQLLRAWEAEVRAAQQAYRAVEGALSYPSLDIWRSQLHMFHNRLGFSIEDECYLATLAALILSDRGGEHLHADWSSDHRAHEDSKLYPHGLAELRATTPPEPRPVPHWPGQRRVPLPERPEGDLTMPLGEVLRRRTSHYARYGQPLPLPTLATLLRGAAGIVDTRVITHPGGQFQVQRRPYPSGGGRYPWRLHLLAYRIESLDPGHYVFDEHSGELVRYGTVPPIELLERSSPFLNPATPDVLPARQVAAWLLPVLDYTYLKAHYHHRAYRHALLECGHLTQNLCLIAAAEGLPHLTIGGFYDDAVNALLHLDGVGEFTTYMVPVGGPA